ncbi:GMP/IMP nucleotidase [Marinobacterium sp. D7]|uniref:GMP/IMP nucleotidase n=1 Tax=Marinobacterium ramblicola TaxID=2849041 RepID=UPI001C2DEA19|nr:GMP/IMP nucleotidase [Marinobacterium ramblicola]MBV1787871.1 GMP/IMP nucleotidase [Marinobacterium ramblicola]
MLDWQAVDTVLLDMDGTLLDLHFDSHFWLEFLPQRYAERHGLDPERARGPLIERIMAERGSLNWYCLDYWSRELDLPVAELKREVADRIGYRPGVEEFLAALRLNGRRTLIVTNAHRDSLSLKVEKTGIDQLVDLVICSHDFGLPKEDVLFWTKLQEVEPFNPKRTLLVDDSLPVLESAKRFGIAHLLCIAQPDSRQPARAITEFNAVTDFAEVMPPNE